MAAEAEAEEEEAKGCDLEMAGNWEGFRTIRPERLRLMLKRRLQQKQKHGGQQCSGIVFRDKDTVDQQPGIHNTIRFSGSFRVQL